MSFSSWKVSGPNMLPSENQSSSQSPFFQSFKNDYLKSSLFKNAPLSVVASTHSMSLELGDLEPMESNTYKPNYHDEGDEGESNNALSHQRYHQNLQCHQPQSKYGSSKQSAPIGMNRDSIKLDHDMSQDIRELKFSKISRMSPISKERAIENNRFMNRSQGNRDNPNAVSNRSSPEMMLEDIASPALKGDFVQHTEREFLSKSTENDNENWILDNLLKGSHDFFEDQHIEDTIEDLSDASIHNDASIMRTIPTKSGIVLPSPGAFFGLKSRALGDLEGALPSKQRVRVSF